MSNKEYLRLFEDRKVRVVWDDVRQEWYFAIVDVVGALAESKDYQTARKYWNKLKERLRKEGDETVTNCHQLKLVAEDGKRRLTDVASTGQLSGLLHAIPSQKTEAFRQWMEQFAASAEQIEETQQSAVEAVGGEIIIYQPDETTRLEVRLEDETVWLTQEQMADLFKTTRNNVTLHIGNIYKEKELIQAATSKESLLVRFEGNRQVIRKHKLYNLDVIISVGYRVRSQRGTRFRQWANQVIKNYLLQGYAVNQQLLNMEQRIDAKLNNQQRQIQKIETTLANHQEKIDFFVRTNQPISRPLHHPRRCPLPLRDLVQGPGPTALRLPAHGNRQKHHNEPTIKKPRSKRSNGAAPQNS